MSSSAVSRHKASFIVGHRISSFPCPCLSVATISRLTLSISDHGYHAGEVQGTRTLRWVITLRVGRRRNGTRHEHIRCCTSGRGQLLGVGLRYRCACNVLPEKARKKRLLRGSAKPAKRHAHERRAVVANRTQFKTLDCADGTFTSSSKVSAHDVQTHL